jgi:hypothetical protein
MALTIALNPTGYALVNRVSKQGRRTAGGLDASEYDEHQVKLVKRASYSHRYGLAAGNPIYFRYSDVTSGGRIWMSPEAAP